MKGRIKCLSLSAVLIGAFIALSAFPTCAVDYGKTYPMYLSQSGGCFIECETTLGKGAIIIPANYQSDYIGFYGDGSNLMNIQSSSISGYFVTVKGTVYNVRASGLSVFQYQETSDYYNRWYDLNITKIYNTNVQFTDNKGDRGNRIARFKPFEIAVISLLTLHCCYDFITFFIKKRA